MEGISQSQQSQQNQSKQLTKDTKLNQSSLQIKQIIKNVILFSQTNGNLFEKYNDQFFLNYFDRNSISRFQRHVINTHKQMQLESFVKLFLDNIMHRQHQTLYLTMSLIRFYKKIKQQSKNQNGVKYSDFTNYLCQKISEDDPDLVIPMKKIPNEKMIPDVSRIRQIDLNPPFILDKTDKQMPKISKQKKKKDKQMEQKKPVGQFIYSQKQKGILTLGRLASFIALYDQNLKVKKKIIPTHSKNSQLAILSFAYSEQYQRIGCIVNNVGITFWQGSDDFKTQKIFAKSQGQKIYYLQLFNEWITTEKNTIYFWDLKEEKITNQIKRTDATFINDICQINHLRSICVSYTLNHEQKCLIVYQRQQNSSFKQLTRLDLGNSGCHSLHYNKFTQTIIPLGYKSTFKVYQINNKTYDINSVAQLKGHTSILSCITHVQNTSLILTGDDIGMVRVWQLNYMRCLQVIKIAKWLGQMSCVGEYLIYSDVRLNLMHMDQINLKPKEDLFILFKFYHIQTQKMWLITRKDMRVMNIQNGKVQKIFVICNQQQDITSANKFNNAILLGTSKGQIFVYGMNGNLKMKLTQHKNQITQIKYDPINRFFISSGIDSNICIWSQKSVQEGPKKMIINNFNGKGVNILQISQTYNVLLTGCYDYQKLCIWDYQTLKLCSVINLRGYPTAVHLSKEYPIIIVATTQQILYFIKYHKKDMKFHFQLLAVLGKQRKNLKRQTYCHNRSSFKKKTPLQQMKANQKEKQTANENQIFPINIIEPNFTGKFKHLFVLGKGIVINIDVSCIINGSFTQQERENIKKGGNINRPIRQSYQRQIMKNQYHTFDLNQQQDSITVSTPSVVWKKILHKEQIIHSEIINLKKKYLCTSSIDGYMKIIQMSNKKDINSDNQLAKCSMNVNYPLPIEWKIQTSNQFQLKKKIYDAMITIDNILKEHRIEMSLYNYCMIDCSRFLKKMLEGNMTISQQNNFFQISNSNCHDNSEKNLNKVKLLRQEFAPSDIKKIPPKVVSLKALQAYKRIKIMKQNKREITDVQFKNEDEQENQMIELQRKKKQFDGIANYFSQQKFSHLVTKTSLLSTSRGQKSSIELKLIDIMKNGSTQPIKRKRELTQHCRQKYQLRKLLNNIQNHKLKLVQNQPINRILKNINDKLMSFKRGYKTKRKQSQI